MRFALVAAATVSAALALAGILLPVRADAPTALAWDSLVDAERAFSRLSEDKGITASFLANFAPDVLTFPEKASIRTGTAHLTTGPPDTGILTWRPLRAEISASGDLGYTTGPYEYRVKADDVPTPTTQGNYVSVWKRHGAKGPWKVVADFGVPGPALAAPGAAAPVPADIKAGRAAVEKMRPAAASADAAEAQKTLLAADAAFGVAAKVKTFSAALGKISGKGIIFLRPGAEALRQAHGPQNVREWTPTSTEAAVSGDLGYTTGTALLIDYPRIYGVTSAQAIPLPMKYLRVWRRENGDPKKPWKLVLEAANASAASKP